MSTQSLKPGALLRHDTYRIEKVLGQGGFGITYLATDLNLERKVAIKEFFPKEYCDRNETTSHVTIGTKNNVDFVNVLKEKFLKEARNIAKFDNPSIIKIHAAFEENDTAYYVMDFIEGMPVSDMVKKNGPLPVADATEYIEKVGEALSYLHAKHVNHLDVKPANIMIRRGDRMPILIDFGLSKQYDSEGNQTSTTPVGLSHGYAPMEQYNDGGVKEFSPQTDLYSLAATYYYMLSGIVPPQATRLVDEELTFTTSVPQALIPSILKAMSSGRRHRHETIREFLVEIDRALKNAGPVEEKREVVEDIVIPPIEEGTQLPDTSGNPPADNDSTSYEVPKYQGAPTTADVDQNSTFGVPDDNKKSKGKIWIGIIAGVAACVAVILAFVLGGGGNKEKVQPRYAENMEMTFFDNAKGTYTGPLDADGKPDGAGTADIVTEDGKVHYEGNFKAGKMDGNAIYTFADGTKFVGTFTDNRYESGTYTDTDGNFFEGTFDKEGMPLKGTWHYKGGGTKKIP